MDIIKLPNSNRVIFAAIGDVESRADASRKGFIKNTGLKGRFYSLVGLAFKDIDCDGYVNKRSAIQYLQRNIDKFNTFDNSALKTDIKNLKLTSSVKSVKKVFNEVKMLELRPKEPPAVKDRTEQIPTTAIPTSSPTHMKKPKLPLTSTVKRIPFNKQMMKNSKQLQEFFTAAHAADLEIIYQKIVQNKEPRVKGPQPKQLSTAINDHQQSSALRRTENKDHMIEGGICNASSLWFASLYLHALKEHPEVRPAVLAKAIAKLFKEGGSEAPGVLQNFTGTRVNFGIQDKASSATKLKNNRNQNHSFLFSQPQGLQNVLRLMPNGCYTFNVALHAMLLIKTEPDLFFFDPNKGLFIFSIDEGKLLWKEALTAKGLNSGKKHPLFDIETMLIGMSRDALKEYPQALKIYNRILEGIIPNEYDTKPTKSMSDDEFKKLQHQVQLLKNTGGVFAHVNLI